jgi:nucleoside-diphosphate-sugar epimerase
MSRRVLVLGGTSFMGRQLIEALLQQNDNKVVMLNRGNQYWGVCLHMFITYIFFPSCN